MLNTIDRQRYVLELCYNGTAYHGWQKQKNAHTVQDAVNNGIEVLLKHPVETVASGRTDTGVHAKQQFAHFDTAQIANAEKFLFQLNAILPADIFVKHIYTAPTDFSARFNALWRRYEYHISFTKNPFYINSVLFLYGKRPNVALMQEATELLKLYTDFESFCKYHTDVGTFECHILEAYWEQVNPDEWVFHIKANRFLRGMVRAIVGTLLQVGKENVPLKQFRDIIEKKDRVYAKASATACGLYLSEIAYPQNTLQLLV